jgi:hypothetical protein
MSTNGTTGHTPAPSRERIVREETYYAAAHGWYDTSEAAQKANLRNGKYLMGGYRHSRGGSRWTTMTARKWMRWFLL